MNIKVGEFYYTYAEASWGAPKFWSGIHECIAVNEDKAILRTLMSNYPADIGQIDDRPFKVDKSAWHHYHQISGDETQGRQDL